MKDVPTFSSCCFKEPCWPISSLIVPPVTCSLYIWNQNNDCCLIYWLAWKLGSKYIYIYKYIYRELEDAGVMFLIYFSAGILAFSEPQRLVLHYFCLILVVMNRKEKISPWWFEPGCCTQQLMWKFSPITKNVTGNKSPSPSHRIIREIPDS